MFKPVMRFGDAALAALVLVAGCSSDSSADYGMTSNPGGAPGQNTGGGSTTTGGTPETGGTPGTGGIGKMPSTGGTGSLPMAGGVGGGPMTGGVGGSPMAGGVGGDAMSTGGTGGSSDAGAADTGGAMSCGDTSSDPMNCGACGRVCRNEDEVTTDQCPPEGCCSQGDCSPFLGDCITEEFGFASCSEFCASIGESCVEGGCGSEGLITWYAWDHATAAQCETIGPMTAIGNFCDDLPWGADSVKHVRCCCSDTVP